MCLYDVTVFGKETYFDSQGILAEGEAPQLFVLKLGLGLFPIFHTTFVFGPVLVEHITSSS